MNLKVKTIIGVATIEFILLIILVGSVVRYMNNTNKESIINYAKTTSTLFATMTKDAVLSDDLASLYSFVDEILKNKDIKYVKIINSDNIVLAEGGDNIPNEFIENKTINIKQKVLNSRAYIYEGDTNYGQIQMGVSSDKLEKSITDTLKLGATIGLIEMFLVAAFSYVLGTYLIRQIKDLKYAAKEISKGNYNISVNTLGSDEISELAKTFNTMINALNETKKESKRYQEELKEVNLSLDDKVRQRTKELSESYEALRDTQSRLVQSEKMASIGQLASGVAHEINNPLSYISMNLETLKGYIKDYQNIISHYNKIDTSNIDNNLKSLFQEVKDMSNDLDIEFLDEDSISVIDDTIDGTNRISDIVSNLKTFARNDNDSFAEISIKDCIDSSLKIVNNKIKYNAEVVLNIPSDLPKINGNSGKLSQVFINLFINSSQAIKDKGIISVSATLENSNIMIVFEDNGSGIEKNNLPKLFDPFFTTKGIGDGTGLGLSITHGIIQDHGGNIKVESEKNIGTKFIISLPTL